MTQLIDDQENASPYVEADSPAEAIRTLDRLEVAPAAAARATYGPCTLTPSYAYLRKSSGRKAVGTKPKTTCSRYVTSIRHSTDMRYRSALWWILAGTVKTGPARNSKAHLSKTVAVRCDGTESTGWVGATLGTIVYRNKTYYARVYTKKATLACGG